MRMALEEQRDPEGDPADTARVVDAVPLNVDDDEEDELDDEEDDLDDEDLADDDDSVDWDD